MTHAQRAALEVLILADGQVASTGRGVSRMEPVPQVNAKAVGQLCRDGLADRPRPGWFEATALGRHVRFD